MRISSITIVRHGETPWTITGQHTGKTDLDLTDLGREQAKKLKTCLIDQRFDSVWTSPSKRARETCKLAGFSDIATIVDELAEWDYGDYEGKTSAQICLIDPKWTIFTKDPPNGETAEEIKNRVDRFLNKISGNVLLFSSGHISRALTARFLGFSVEYGKHLALSPASISILGYEHNQPVIKLWNCVSTS